MLKLKLGDLLIQEGLLTEDQAQEIFKYQEENKEKRIKFGTVATLLGFVSAKDVMQVLSQQMNVDYIDIYAYAIDFKSLRRFNITQLHKLSAIPFFENEIEVHVAISDPLNSNLIQILSTLIPYKKLKIFLALEHDIEHVFRRFEIITNTDSIIRSVKQEINNIDINKNDSAIMSLIEQIMKTAILYKASDIHIEPNQYQMTVRVRINGFLKEIFLLDLDIYEVLRARLKMLANLEMSEKKRAQDGRYSLKVNSKDYDFRISTIPTIHGESIVIRILDSDKILLKMNQLGMKGKNLELFNNMLHRPHGIILITGPTGAGKTTTLYAGLNELKDIDNKIITIEDPIEYLLPLVQQTQVNKKNKIGFLDLLKSVVRQDPDIIMVGEIRNYDTLDAVAQASMTGHLVFSSLHSNSSYGSITRMTQMGLDRFIIAEALSGIVAQRLVRKICPECKIKYKPKKQLLDLYQDELKLAGLEDDQLEHLYKGSGCAKCDQTGYSGMIMISEILFVNNEIKLLISDEKSTIKEIIDAARKNGFTTLFEDGLSKVKDGITTIEEVVRVAG